MGPPKNPEIFSKINCRVNEILTQVYDEPMGRMGQGVKTLTATRFSDSATPTCVKIKSRPKYTTTSGLTATTFFAIFSENN